MRIFISILIFGLIGYNSPAFAIDSLSVTDSVRLIILRNLPKIYFKDMGAKYFAYSFIVYIDKDSLRIKYADNFSDEGFNSVPLEFVEKVNEKYKLLQKKLDYACVLVIPVMYKTYTSLDVPVGFERALGNLFPKTEIRDVTCLNILEPIVVIGQYMYTKKDEDFQ